ncbi:MAG TPA: Na+/H+ antiporter NhaA, partial [Cryomorphaceae bacterium]|nr:Na+/H+ antiporter NhaA [Cryomorphaceae bacterium]
MQENQTPFDYVRKPFTALVKNEAAIGIILFLSAVLAMIVANSSWGAEWYHELWERELTLQYEDRELTLNLHHFINDGLMAIFFFLVGLEIKREFLAGELSEWRQAVLPIGAALGGMIFPALIYLLFTDSDTSHGWGIPMATDIAFTLGLISFVRKRVPSSVKVFVTSLAVVDDIGAVLVIAFFYTSSLDMHQLIIAGGAWLLLMGANRLGVRSVFFYSFIGITVIWISFFYSGIHPTIAGILLAFTIPAKTRISKEQFTERLKRLYRKYLKTETYTMAFNTGREEKLLKGMRSASDDARTPLQKIETSLHPLVYYIIMPLFAFANAGLKIEANFFELLLGPVGLGVICGLIVGKF